MARKQTWAIDAPVGLGYFLLSTLSILTTRFDGGLAYLWLASPFLITVLLRRPRKTWANAVLWAAAGNALATIIFGAGWMLAIALVPANMAEALTAAYFLRVARSSLLPFGSVRWFRNLVSSAGVAGPLAMGLIAMLPIYFMTGQAPVSTLIRVLLGHGLCNLTFIPVLKLFATGKNIRWHDAGRDYRYWTYGLFIAQVVVTFGVFAQSTLPLLFLPILPVVGIVYQGNSRQSAASLLLLATISGGMTLAGNGPVLLAEATLGREVQFLQFYLLVTVMTVIPIASGLRNRAHLARRVHDSEVRYRMLAEHSSDIITHSDLHGLVLFASPSIERISGFRPAALKGRNLLDLIDPRDHAMVEQNYAWAIVNPGCPVRFEYRGRTGDGALRWFESVCRGVAADDGRTASIVSIVREISERKRKEEELMVAASTDALTGIANRRAFRHRALSLIADQRVARTALALIDIDHFKRVNDRFGHDAGDEVLKGFGAIAARVLRRNDFIARVGGEEFAILFPGLSNAEAAKVCERIRLRVAAACFQSGAGPVRITISGGVTDLSTDGFDAALKRADAALYEAKSNGRDQLTLAA